MKAIFILAILFQDAEIRFKSGDKVQAKIDTLTIDTKSLGKIDIKGSDLYAILLTKHRPLGAEIVKKKIEELVIKLGDFDPDTREKATEELKNMGAEAFPLVEKHKDHQDIETRTRIQAILNVLKDIKVRSSDTILGKGFILNGIIISVVCGGKDLDLTSIKSIKITKKYPIKETGPVFTFDDGSKIQGRFKSETLKLLDKDETNEIKTKKIEKIDFKQKVITVYFRTELQGDILGNIQVDTPFAVIELNKEKILHFNMESLLSYQYLEGDWIGKAQSCNPNTGNMEQADVTVKFTTNQNKIDAIIELSDGSEGIFKGTLDDHFVQGTMAFKSENWVVTGKIDGNKIKLEAVAGVYGGARIFFALDRSKD